MLSAYVVSDNQFSVEHNNKVLLNGKVVKFMTKKNFLPDLRDKEQVIRSYLLNIEKV